MELVYFFIFEHTLKILLTIFTVSGQNSFTYFVKFITTYWIFWPKSVLVCQWFHKKIPQTHDLNDRNYFHTILEVKSPRLRCGQGCFFWVISLLFSYGWPLAVSSNDHPLSTTAHGVTLSSYSLLIRTTKR